MMAKEILSMATVQQTCRNQRLEQDRGRLQGNLFQKEKEKETQTLTAIENKITQQRKHTHSIGNGLPVNVYCYKDVNSDSDLSKDYGFNYIGKMEQEVYLCVCVRG